MIGLNVKKSWVMRVSEFVCLVNAVFILAFGFEPRANFGALF
jgi:hypothetical protein